MPAYPYLFEVKDKLDPGEQEVKLPPGYAPIGKVVVASGEAMNLVAYLKALDRSYPILESAEATKK